MAWPLTGSALTKYNRLLSDLRQYGDFIFVGAPDDITWLQEIIVAASDGALRPSLDDVANRSHYWMLELSRVLGEKVVVCPDCPECPPVIPCPPCPDNIITTTPPGLENEFGVGLSKDIPGLTDIVIRSIGGVNSVEAQTDLISVVFPNLSVITITEFVLFHTNPSLTSFSLPALATVSGTGVSVYDNPALTSLSLGSGIFEDGTSVYFGGNALTDTSVNHILARAVANAAYVSGSVDVSGGTNSAPTGQGIADKATLIGRGVTVNTN